MRFHGLAGSDVNISPAFCASGPSRSGFASLRVVWVHRRLRRRSVLSCGCGARTELTPTRMGVSFQETTRSHFTGSAPTLGNFGCARLGLPADFQFQFPVPHVVQVLTRRVVNGDPTDATTGVSTSPIDRICGPGSGSRSIGEGTPAEHLVELQVPVHDIARQSNRFRVPFRADPGCDGARSATRSWAPRW